MISNKTIITLFLIVTIGILLWFFGFFSRYNYLTAKSDIAKNNPQIVYVGESMLSPSDLNSVSKKYGFEIVGFGRTLSAVEQNGIEIYNSQMKKYLDEINETDWKSEFKKRIDSLMKLTNIPKTAFWIEKNGVGYWYNVDSKKYNVANIQIFDRYGDLIKKGRFMLVCPSDEIEYVEDLKSQIEIFDGENIQFKSNCFLMSR